MKWGGGKGEERNGAGKGEGGRLRQGKEKNYHLKEIFKTKCLTATCESHFIPLQSEKL